MDRKELNPSVLVVCCDEIQTRFIIKMILETEGLPISSKVVEGVQSYPWHISTKYYEADVLLHTLSQKVLLPQSLALGVQAVVLFFDSSKDNGLEYVESWQTYLRDYEVDISILVCKRCTDSPTSGVSKLSAQEWCVQHGYELVELDPELDEEWEAEQDFIETTGIKRIVQALHAHIWPNLILKDRREPTSMSALLHGGHMDSEMNQLKLDTLPSVMADGNIEERLEELLGCSSETDFYQLFGDLQMMKERVTSLPSEERKACAEQVVLAFWKAIGGDSEEVDSTLDQEPPN